MARQRPWSNNHATCEPGSGFEIRPVVEFDPFAPEPNAELLGDRRCEGRVLGRTGPETVVNVDRFDVEISSDGESDECR